MIHTVPYTVIQKPWFCCLGRLTRLKHENLWKIWNFTISDREVAVCCYRRLQPWHLPPHTLPPHHCALSVDWIVRIRFFTPPLHLSIVTNDDFRTTLGLIVSLIHGSDVSPAAAQSLPLPQSCSWQWVSHLKLTLQWWTRRLNRAISTQKIFFRSVTRIGTLLIRLPNKTGLLIRVLPSQRDE
jgi:hypothetical protein